ncbi:unnamed protein product [Diplocarpon coronariae]
MANAKLCIPICSLPPPPPPSRCSAEQIMVHRKHCTPNYQQLRRNFSMEGANHVYPKIEIESSVHVPPGSPPPPLPRDEPDRNRTSLREDGWRRAESAGSRGQGRHAAVVPRHRSHGPHLLPLELLLLHARTISLGDARLARGVAAARAGPVSRQPVPAEGSGPVPQDIGASATGPGGPPTPAAATPTPLGRPGSEC